MLVTSKKLAEILMATKGSTFVHLDLVTNQKLKKTGNPYRDQTIKKHQSLTVLVNFIYGNSVNRRLEKMGQEPNFQVKDRPWGEHIQKDGKKTCIIEHKDSLYLEYQPVSTQSKAFTLEGKPIEESKFSQFYSSRPSLEGMSKADAASLSDEELIDWAALNVKYRNVKLEGVKAATINGIKYIVSNDLPESAKGIEATLAETETELATA